MVVGIGGSLWEVSGGHARGAGEEGRQGRISVVRGAPRYKAAEGARGRGACIDTRCGSIIESSASWLVTRF